MNVNLSNVSATNKASVSDSSNKVDAENPESKGFFETLAGVFTDSQKAEKAVAKSDAPDAALETSEKAGKVVSQTPQGESQEKVAQDTGNATSTESADELLAQGEGKQATNSSVESSENDASSDNVKASNSSDDTSPSETKVSKADVADQASESQVKSAMGEGQQLLGRIEQANQTLKTNEQLIDSGKALPPEAAQTHGASQQVKDHVVTPDQQAVSISVKSVEQDDVLPIHAAEKVALDANGKPIATAVEVSPNAQTSNAAQSTASTQIDWNSPSSQAAHNEAMVNATTQAAVNGQVVAQGVQVLAGTEALQSVLPADAQTTNTEVADVQRISPDELQVIDTKLAQGKPLSQQELDVIEGLKTGELVADIPVQELAQFVALPSDVKVAMAEHQAAHNQTRVAASTVAAQQAHQLVTQDMKHAAAQASGQAAASPNADKAALSAMPEALVAANLNPAAQAASSAELSKKVINAGLAAGALKGVTNKQDKPDPQHGLAGQIQAAAGQQGVTAQQQARVDAAQQAQLPLQLTKELANDQVAEKVQMMMSKNLKNLDIRLDPPELGRMQIRMTMNNDLANVHFTVANPQARDLIEQTLPRLREMLAQQGMQLADSSVQQQSSGQQQSGYANAEQNGQGSQGRGFSGQSDENFDADTNLDLNVVSKRDGISFYA
ncbi:flagellar hook-length control protein FliK [Vibrio campbellii]|nr:flagellar hook-length control protein FliK [Vibrio campbellii]MBT0121340.1 flagellar hook-length control protein FliK [Vibrio campbellii]MBT0136477.1 flagellar hook-length control protein FliK [Vibrio campbellii]MBT0141078.1 flagellar hook-length control protein FliK [Vibrio campbellii]MBT0145862.1 flagellar hook-length control protein FliK [Vibrio campbellii]MBT0150516.1 flagellar hook-length control protein FliK [Vibrio campbellii]